MLLVPVVIGTGLVATRAVDSLAGDLLGAALYAVLVYVLLGVARPAWPVLALAGVTIGICAVIEFAQLTGVPAQLVDAFAPARYVLGSTFAAHDLPAYGVGALLAGSADAWVLRRAAASGTLRT